MVQKNLASILARLDMEETKKLEQDELRQFFNNSENDYLSGRHIRTTIGWLALKKAIVELADSEVPTDLHEKDIHLQCLDDGRPAIVEISSCPGLAEKIFVSISHTRTMAYGLAAFQEEFDGQES